MRSGILGVLGSVVLFAAVGVFDMNGWNIGAYSVGLSQ